MKSDHDSNGTLSRPGVERRRLLVGGAASMLALWPMSGCGYILYPQRKGRTGGHIDVPILIIDLLWLLPGLIPGIVCLAVDFTTGCIYEHGEKSSRDGDDSDNDRRIAADEASASIEIDGRIAARGEVAKDGIMRIAWNRPISPEALRQRGRLLIRAKSGALAEARMDTLLETHSDL